MPKIPDTSDWLLPGEPHASLYTPEWQQGMFALGLMPEPERAYYAAFFAHLDAGWKTVRTLQLAAETLLYGHSPEDDVANWLDVEITDNYRWLAQACLQMIPSLRIFAEDEPAPADKPHRFYPFGPEPPVDEFEFEVRVLARNVRLLAAMEGAASFPAALRGIVAPAASALTAWEREAHFKAAPVLAYVVSMTPP
jgi:hypothetical protein